jgi:prepilin-type N-terminal cleavage/methylation domain-containing protein
MQKNHNNKGFSLSEVLMATAILAIGLVFIAGTFPVGISLTAATVERTTAAVVADEAFAKISFLGVDDDWPKDAKTDICTAYEDAAKKKNISSEEFAYPSLLTTLPPQYCWSALCRTVDAKQKLAQVTVFVCRKTQSDWPRPVRLPTGPKENLFVYGSSILSDYPVTSFLRTNATILDDRTGQLYRIVNLKPDKDNPNWWEIVLDRLWPGAQTDPVPAKIWVVPPPVGGGRYPVIGIYQKIIKF